MREELKPIEKRLDGVEKRLDGVETGIGRLGDAVMFLTNCWPGTMPGHRSHVAREVEKIIKPD